MVGGGGGKFGELAEGWRFAFGCDVQVEFAGYRTEYVFPPMAVVFGQVFANQSWR
jgi:hypothetical protein